jgi:hypothetical protein
MARQDCKTALGLRDEQAQRSAKQKGWREFLDSYPSIRVCCVQKKEPRCCQARLFPVLPSDA